MVDQNDDKLEDERDEFEKDENMFHPDQVPRLAEDGAPPAESAHDVPGSHVPIDYPTTDTGVDAQEEYDEGIGNASGATNNVEDSDEIEKAIDENQDTTGHAR